MDDTYAYQREELLDLLKKISKDNGSLVLQGSERLTADDAARLLHKIRQNTHFSAREKSVLTEAGFDVRALFPKL